MNAHQSSLPPASVLTVEPIRGRRPVLQNCTIAELAIDPTYQRSIDNGSSRALIRRIAREWNWALFQPLVVAQRPDAGLFVVDGQHRLAAARLRKDVYDLPCVITSYADPAEEAATFVALNRQRRPLRQIDVFKAALAAGDEAAEQAMTLISAAGLSLARSTNPHTWAPGMIVNVGGIQGAIRQHGAESTGIALRVLAQAFDGQVLQYGGSIFPGIARTAADLAAALDEQLLVMVLQGDDQPGWWKHINEIVADRAVHRSVAAGIAVRSAYDDASAEMAEAAE